MEIEIDVKRHSQILPAIQSGLSDGLKDAGQWMLDTGERRAKDAIMSADRIWHRTLKEGFETEGSGEFTRQSGWKGKITNTAPHASLNERGLKPGSSPPVQKIAPWVNDRIATGIAGNSHDTSNWDPDLQALAERYSPGVVVTSFAVKNKLENKGYSGIGFMETTETYLKTVGPPIVKQKVEKHLRREVREHGLS